MALLRPYQQKSADSAGTTSIAEDAAGGATEAPLRKGQTPKKGRPTKTRAEAEAERMARLHPTQTPKERRRAAAAARREQREGAWERQQSSPERALMRDYVDSRWTITEFVLPVMLVFMAFSFAFPRQETVQMVIMIAMLVLLAAWLLNTTLFWRGYKREAHERIKNPNFRGVLMEMNSRMMSIRRFRNPAPRVQRGESY